MKEENERRIVAEKQVAEIDDKIVQCKSNISVANDLIDLTQVNIKQAVEEKNPQKSRQLTQQALSKLQMGQRENKNLKKIFKNYKMRNVGVWQRKINECSF